MNASAFDIIPCGDDALRIVCGAGDIRYALASQLVNDDAWQEIVPGKADLTVAFDPHTESMSAAMARLRDALQSSASFTLPAPRRIELTATFGGAEGPDLEALAERLGRSAEDILTTVEASKLKVDMLGFTPGFAYLTGLDQGLTSERLANPRPRVPAGSIGLITGQIGLYALDGPGGWPIIGRVNTPLFDRFASEPFLLSPGDEVAIRRRTGA
ncbi:MAG: carboxyltransferase domain-containing protein [Hyphomonas sp.]